MTPMASADTAGIYAIRDKRADVDDPAQSRGSTVESASPSITGRVLLVVGEGRFDSHPLAPGRTVIGRDSRSGIVLRHSKISRQHAVLHVGAAVEVEDCGSTNGTIVAARTLGRGERAVVPPGKHLQLGPFMAVLLEAAEPIVADGPIGAAINVLDPTPQGVPEVVRRIATATVSVLITGETGAGKEVLAQTIHELSGRRGELVTINSASLSEALLESELFGHERGSFTGAATTKQGLFEIARGGTVFLDEIGELPASLQAKLLRVLETKEALRVGGTRPVSLDVRFLAATHRSLVDDARSGKFRQDLYFRVNGISLEVAPLRARREAIPTLAAALLAKAIGPARTPPAISPSALDALLTHDWPGNVRELRSVMERAAVVCEEGVLRRSHVIFDNHCEPPQPKPRESPAVADPSALGDERARIIAALAACAGNQTLAARRLGISRSTLIHRLDVYRIPRPRGRAYR